MKQIPLLLTFILFLFTTDAQNDFKPVSESELIIIKNNIKNKNTQIQTLICPFVQTKKMAVLKEDNVMSGMMYYKRPNQFRWEYTGDKPFVFVQIGEKCYTKVNDRVTEIKENGARQFKEISKLVIASMNGDILENTKNFKTEFLHNNNMVIVTLIPTQKAMQNALSKIILHFSKTTQLVTKIEIFEGSDDITIIQFENNKINQTINQNIFELK
jgi:outer membrane lipoprotein carrier protein